MRARCGPSRAGDQRDVDPRTRRELTRYGAPAAFLAAATIAVLLIKAGLSGGNESEPTTVGALPTAAPTTTAPRTTTRLVLTNAGTATAEEGQYYVVQSGDTLGSIALEHDTTVEELLRLNPDVDPTALNIGQRIRVS
jgi:LysM repeat protein